MNKEYDSAILAVNAALRQKDFKQLLDRLKKMDSGRVDKQFHELHEDAFNKIDCLECANCCRSLGPRITDTDIRRISVALKIKERDFIEKYLHLDEDKDFVFKQMPCPFLDAENYCTIYENRPKACREYPHTDRKRVIQIADLTLKNASVCPAVFYILEGIKGVK